MKVLVIGSGGMLGHTLTGYLLENGFDVTDISRTRKFRKNTILMDVCETERFADFYLNEQFDAVINCAALLHGGCANNPDKAIFLNSYFPHFLHNLSRNLNNYIIQISSGGVYKGDVPPYHENCPHDSISFYGKTKSLGEIEGDNVLTIRSDVIGPDMSPNSTSLFNWIMTSSGEVNGYAHMSINGVTSLEYSKFILKCLEEERRPIGFYNLHSDGSISKADFLRLVIEIFGLEGISVKDVLQPMQNNSLSSIRTDITYARKDYETQLIELKDWMYRHKELYKHYYLK